MNVVSYFQGSANRKVAATNMNRASSRSHSVFTCVIESKVKNNSLVRLVNCDLKHSVFTCVTESKLKNISLLTRSFFQWESQGVTHHRFARLNLVDLAGSERLGVNQTALEICLCVNVNLTFFASTIGKRALVQKVSV